VPNYYKIIRGSLPSSTFWKDSHQSKFINVGYFEERWSQARNINTWDLFYFNEKYISLLLDLKTKNILITEQNMNLISQATSYKNYNSGGEGAVDETHAFGVRCPGLNPLRDTNMSLSKTFNPSCSRGMRPLT